MTGGATGVAAGGLRSAVDRVCVGPVLIVAAIDTCPYMPRFAEIFCFGCGSGGNCM